MAASTVYICLHGQKLNKGTQGIFKCLTTIVIPVISCVRWHPQLVVFCCKEGYGSLHYYTIHLHVSHVLWLCSILSLSLWSAYNQSEFGFLQSYEACSKTCSNGNHTDICWCGCNWVELMFVQTTHNYSHQLLSGSPLQKQDCNKLWIGYFLSGIDP